MTETINEPECQPTNQLVRESVSCHTEITLTDIGLSMMRCKSKVYDKVCNGKEKEK